MVPQSTYAGPGAETHRAKSKPQPETSSGERPEWLRVDKAASLYGLSRSLLYELIADGSIKSANIRRRNALKGRRLVNADSLAAFVESHVEKRGSEVAA